MFSLLKFSKILAFYVVLIFLKQGSLEDMTHGKIEIEKVFEKRQLSCFYLRYPFP